MSCHAVFNGNWVIFDNFDLVEDFIQNKEDREKVLHLFSQAKDLREGRFVECMCLLCEADGTRGLGAESGENSPWLSAERIGLC